MEFIRTSINTADKKQVYRMTKGDSAKIEGLEKGLSIPVDNYALYKETKERNKMRNTRTKEQARMEALHAGHWTAQNSGVSMAETLEAK